jgi:type I restriction enzyme S subunit
MSENVPVKFGDMAYQITTKVKPRETTLTKYIGLEHLNSGSLQITRFGTPNDVVGEKLRVCKGDIIFVKRRVYQRKVAISDVDGICSAHAMILRPKEDVVDKDFFPFFMQSDYFMERALQISVGSLSPTINWKTLAEQEFTIPSLPEQHHIAITLWVTEDCIEKVERFLVSAEKAKQVLMRELFRKGIGHKKFEKTVEFGDIPQVWQITRIQDHLIEYRDGAPLTPGDFVKKGVKVIPKKAVVRGGFLLIPPQEQTFTTDTFTQKYETSVVNGDYLITTLRDLIPSAPNIGLIVKIPTIDNYILAQGVYGLKLKDSIFEDFLIQYSQSEYYRKTMQRIKVGSTQVHIRNNDFFTFTFPLPPLPEQRQIATVLTRCDETIAAARANVAAAKALKMKMINEMLKE